VHRREGIGVERAAVGWFFLLCLMCVLKARVQFDVSVSVGIIVTEELLEDVTTYKRERLVYKKERETGTVHQERKTEDRKVVCRLQDKLIINFIIIAGGACRICFKSLWLLVLKEVMSSSSWNVSSFQNNLNKVGR